MEVKEKTSSLLEDLIKTNKIVNAYIFYGMNGLALKGAAFFLVEQYFSTKNDFKLSEDNLNNLPDLLYFSTENSSIKVDDIHSIQERIKYGPSSYDRMFVIIDQADLFTVQAANAFLKTLEEPIDGITFILLTTRFKQLIPTIRSRCQHLYVPDQQQFNLNLNLTSNTTPNIELISFNDFIELDKVEKFNHIEQLAKEKVTAKQQIDFWIKTAFEKENHSYVFKLLEIRNHLEFNVNVRLQLEQLIL
tara:strand:+ start:156 stop:896 length:741 start_codon:yes stop_codon:yes gene_type:complete